MGGRPLIACEHCAALHERVPIPPRSVAKCTRCGFALYRQSGVSLSGWIALTLASLVTFGIANGFPIAVLRVAGRSIEATLPGALFLTWQEGHPLLAIMTGLFGFWFPLTQIIVVLWALLSLRSRRLPGDFGYGLRMLHHVENWSMVPVLMLGFLVAIVKFSGLASLQVGPALIAFGVLTFLLTGLSRVTAHRLWRYAEDEGLAPAASLTLMAAGSVACCNACGFLQQWPQGIAGASCQRCGAAVHRRKPDMTSRVWAFVAAATIMYAPANLLPVMQIRTPTGATNHTILGGVLELWEMGSWDLAVIVFTASIVVPMTKLLALAVLMIRRRWQGASIQRQRTRLYELIEFIGQWSMLDVFVVLLMAAMANFPGISQVLPGLGAASFGSVVILTMFATLSYDPREGWDADPRRAHGGDALNQDAAEAATPYLQRNA